MSRKPGPQVLPLLIQNSKVKTQKGWRVTFAPCCCSALRAVACCDQQQVVIVACVSAEKILLGASIAGAHMLLPQLDYPIINCSLVYTYQRDTRLRQRCTYGTQNLIFHILQSLCSYGASLRAFNLVALAYSLISLLQTGIFNNSNQFPKDLKTKTAHRLHSYPALQ